MEVTQSKEPTQGAKADQKPEIDPAIIDELMKGCGEHFKPGARKS
jgi:hypothetical protein